MYTPSLDLRGKRIQDTYQNVLEYDSSSQFPYNGLGNQVDLSASYALKSTSASYAIFASLASFASSSLTASWASQSFSATSASWSSQSFSATSASWASQSFSATSASWASQSFSATSASWASRSFSATSASWASSSISSSISFRASSSQFVDGLNIVSIVPSDTTIYNPILVGSTIVNDSHSHATIKVNGKLYGGGWDGKLYVFNDPDNDITDITMCNAITYPRNLSAVCYSDITGYLYFTVGSTGTTTGITGSILRVDPNDITGSQTDFYDGFPVLYEGLQYMLSPIVTDGNYLYGANYVDNDSTSSFWKIDANTGILVASSSWMSASIAIKYAHAAVISPTYDYFYVTTTNGYFAKVSTSDLSYTTKRIYHGNGISPGTFTDDMAILNGKIYAADELDFYLFTIDTTDLSYISHSTNHNSYGVYTNGSHIYVLLTFGEILIYPNADIDSGPIHYKVTGSPNELWFVNDTSKIAYTRWNAPDGIGRVYFYNLPLTQVGINKQPDVALDVIGTFRASEISSSDAIYSPNITFGNILKNTGSSIQMKQDGSIIMRTISGSATNSGMVIRYITASMITASAGFYGTSSWAISASWAPGGSGVTPGGSYDISCSWASSSLTASYLIGGGIGDVTVDVSNNIYSKNTPAPTQASNIALGLNSIGYNGGNNGSSNIALGDNTLAANIDTDSSNNIAIGPSSMTYNVAGHNNIGLGSHTLAHNSGSYNIGIGYYNLAHNDDGNNNIGIGYQSIYSVIGRENIAIGTNAFNTLFNANYNIALGSNAGAYLHNGSTQAVTPNHCIFIGANSTALTTTDTNEIVIGSGSKGSGSNTIVLGNSSITSTTIYGPITGSILSSSYALTASWAPGGSGVTPGGSYDISCSWASRSLWTNSASWASQSFSSVSASWASQSLSTSYISASNVDGTVNSSSYALTSSYLVGGNIIIATMDIIMVRVFN